MSRADVIALIDAYLVGDERDRASVFAKIGAWTCDVEEAAPIVRAIALIGPRAADESLIALRLVVDGKAATDERIGELRGIVKKAMAGDAEARSTYQNRIAQPA